MRNIADRKQLTAALVAEAERYVRPENDETKQQEQAFKSNTTLEELTYPGGLVEALIDWIVSSAERPSRPLALSAVLPFLGALIGRRFRTPTDLRSNVYSIALAPSGYGKEHARTQLKRLIDAAELNVISGPGRFMSATALRNCVIAKPSCFCMVDEFGGMLRQITDRNAGIHNLLIRDDLLAMFSSAATFFDGAEFAQVKAVKIYNPNLCIYGTSTLDDFWGAVSSLQTTDGLLARLLLFSVDDNRPVRVVPAAAVSDLPAPLVDSCRALALAHGGTLHDGFRNGGEKVASYLVPLDTDAKTELEKFKTSIDDLMVAGTAASRPVLHRAAEHAIKLALILSVSTKCKDPTISGHHMQWAVKLAWHSTCKMIQEASEKISDNTREANKKRILEHIKKAGKEGITEGRIADRCGSIDKRQRSEIIEDLRLGCRIAAKTVAPVTGRPRTRWYFEG